MAKFIFTKNNDGITSFNIPRFHHSIIPLFHDQGNKLKPEKIHHIFIEF